VGGVGSEYDSSPWISCSAVRTISIYLSIARSGNCLECFPLEIQMKTYCRIMYFKWFENSLVTLARLMDSNNCLSKTTADVVPPWHCVNTHLDALDQQTAKNSTFIKLVTLTEDQIIKDVDCNFSSQFL